MSEAGDSSAARFDDAIRLTARDEGLVEGEFQDRTWWVQAGPHGGLVASVMLNAIESIEPDRGRRPRYLTVRYLAAPREGPFTVEAWVERSGRSLTSLSARMLQGGRATVLAWAGFAGAIGAVRYDDSAPPEVQPASELSPPPAAFEDLAPPFARLVDYRFALGSTPFSGGDRALSGGWFRLRERRLIDYKLAAFLADAWPPAIYSRLGTPLAAPTVELSVVFRAELPPPGGAADDFYLGRFASEAAGEGFWEEDGRIWDAQGQLLVQSRQLALTLGG